MISSSTLIIFGALVFDLVSIFYKHLPIPYAIGLSLAISALVYYLKTVLNVTT